MNTLIIASLFSSIVTEHQIRLCDDNQNILSKLKLNEVQSKKFNVYYLETSAREMSALGVSARVRVKQNSVEITVKKRLGNSQTGDKGAICENDLHGSVKEFSCKINSSVNKKEFEKVMAGKKNWLEILSSEQLNFLKKYNGALKDAVVYGTLKDERYQWNDKQFGEITVDLVGRSGKEEIKYNEISIRYDDSNSQTGNKFESFFKNTGVKACADQIDWPVNKFDTLEILD